jgi:hypothetical protein
MSDATPASRVFDRDATTRQLHPLLAAGVARAALHWLFDPHTNPETQSLIDAQLSLHAAPSQTYGAQSRVTPVGDVRVRPSVQLDPEMHVPLVASHSKPGVQSAVEAHALLHAVAPQT